MEGVDDRVPQPFATTLEVKATDLHVDEIRLFLSRLDDPAPTIRFVCKQFHESPVASSMIVSHEDVADSIQSQPIDDTAIVVFHALVEHVSA